jgi:L-rhamnose mutarotase
MKENQTGQNKLKRKAFKMRLNPGQKSEYKRRHDEIWSELSEVLHDAGVRDYSIYLDEETNTLFAFQQLTFDNTADNLPDNPVVKKWWAYMADIMETNPDKSPLSVNLEEVFHME